MSYNHNAANVTIRTPLGGKFNVLDRGSAVTGEFRASTEIIRPLLLKNSSLVVAVEVRSSEGEVIGREMGRIKSNADTAAFLINKHRQEGLEAPKVRDSLPLQVVKWLTGSGARSALKLQPDS